MSDSQSVTNVADIPVVTSTEPEKGMNLFEVSGVESEGSEALAQEKRSMTNRSSSSFFRPSSRRVTMQLRSQANNSFSGLQDSQGRSVVSAKGSTSSSGRLRLRSRPRTSISSQNSLEHITAVVHAYPVMQVANTVFDSQFGRSSTNESTSLSRSGSIAESSVTEASSEKHEVAISEQLGRKRPHESVMPLVCRVKREIMWRLAITHALAVREWHRRFRFEQLCNVLKRLLLPVIIQRRSEPTVGGKKWFRRHQQDAVPMILEDDEGEIPQGATLAERCPQIALFENPWLSELLAASVVRYRYSAGDAIVAASSPSQEMLYILISGRCDAISPKESVEEKKLPHRRHLANGEVFGGFLGGRDTFTETFRAVSMCIIWALSRQEFEKSFDQCSNESMRARYIAMLEEHYMKRLLRVYPVKENLSRVPIYRRLDRPIQQYEADFKPVVMTNRTVLFNQNDPPGAVYCLLEGEVCRDQLDPDTLYDPQTQQILTLNEAPSTFALNTRFLLLGEEPHILPHRLRYRCTVTSRAALFYRIEGESFVSALLDDPNLLLQLRKSLVTHFRASMHLSPEALLTVPILRSLPKHSLNAIANAAQPRVVERGQSICEQARTITEIYVITGGNLMDPREIHHQPTCPVSPPPPAEEEQEVEASTLPRGRNLKERGNYYSTSSKQTSRTKGKRENNKPMSQRTIQNGGRKAAPGIQSGFAAGRPVTYNTDAGQGGDDMVFNASHVTRWSFFGSLGDTPPLVYPDEQQEFSPLLVPNPARTIVCTVGGGWEGLLIDKWPYGWETVTTVEVWALPMLKIRTEFSSMPKAMQNVVLAYVREMQMKELDLAAPIVAKLPPMSTYQPPERRHAQHPALGQDVISRSSSIVTERRGRQNTLSATRNNEDYSLNVDVDFSFSQMNSDGASSQNASVSRPRRLKQEQQEQQKEGAAKCAAKPSSSHKENNRGHANGAEPTTDRENPNGDANEGAGSKSPEAPKRKAGPPPLLYLRRLATKRPEETPVITPELCAIYAGKQDPAETGILRSPPPVRKLLVPEQRSLAWPVSQEPRKEWFDMVPSFEPLPGTVKNQILSPELPSLVPNTAGLLKRAPRYGSQLTAHAAYFASVAESRYIKEQEKGERASNNVDSSVTPKKASAVIGQPAPGRYTYTL